MDILSVTPEEISRGICEYVSLMDGVSEDMKENLYRAVLPIFHAGGMSSG